MRQEPIYVQRRQRGLVVLIVALVLLVIAVVTIGSSMFRNDVKDFAGEGDGVIHLVEIKEGSSLSELGPKLVEDGIVASDSAFQTAALNNPDSSTVAPGFYRLQGNMSAENAVKALLDPDNKVQLLDVPGGATLMDVKVVGGNTRSGIYSQIAEITCDNGTDSCLSVEELQDAAAHADPAALGVPSDVKVVGGNTRSGIYSQIAEITCDNGTDSCLSVEELQDAAAHTDPAALGVPSWAAEQVASRGDDPKRLEGLIVPGQYVINPGSDAQSILKDLITRSASTFESTQITQRAEAIGLSPYELLTAASLIEREAPANDFDKVARVILNRLAQPQRLEFDSTVNYGLDEQEVATTDEDRGRETAWNTYAMDGLPATPIASASLKAIEAMENPAEGDWLYFVTIDSNGTTVFNNNFEDHQAATQESINNGVLDSNR